MADVKKDKSEKGPREPKVCGELFIGENVRRDAEQQVCAAPKGHEADRHSA